MTTPASSMYPDFQTVSTFGPLYLPQIYGSNMSSFELASSGSIALTARDVTSLMMDRDCAASNVYLYTLCNDNLIIKVHDSNVGIKMDGTSNMMNLYTNCNMYLDAASNIQLTAGEKIIFKCPNLSFNADDFMSLASLSNNLKIAAYSNLFLEALHNDVVISASSNSVLLRLGDSNISAYAQCNIGLSASNDLSLYAKSNIFVTASNGSYTLSAASNNFLFALDSYTSNASLFATSNIIFAASNDAYLNAISNVHITASNESVLINGGDGTLLQLGHCNIAAFAVSNFSASASNDIALYAQSNVFVTASNGSFVLSAASNCLLFTLDSYTSNASLYATSNIVFAASNDAYLNAISNVHITASNESVLINGGDGTLLQLGHCNIAAFAISNISASASNDIALYAQSNVLVTASNGSFVLSAASNNVVFSLEKDTFNASLYATSNIILAASNSAFISAVSNLTIAASNDALSLLGGNGTLFTMSQSNVFAFAASNFTALASNDVALYASSNVAVNAYLGSFTVTAASNNTMFKLDKDTYNASLFTTSNIIFGASNDLFLSAVSNVTITASNESLTLHGGCNTIFTMSHSNISAYAANKFDFFIGAFSNDALMTVSSNLVQINGNLQVAGVIDSINVTQTTLSVSDKEIYLSYNSNIVQSNSATWVVDGVANDKSGIVVQGLPQDIPQYSASNNEQYYGKSLVWNKSYGMNFLGSNSPIGGPSYAGKESFWELKGGALRISQPVDIIQDVDHNVFSCSNISYHFRINSFQELEIVKVSSVLSDGIITGTPTYQTVSRFGRSVTI